jgi:hypothetical protein
MTRAFDKPIALINASLRATCAQASVTETLTVMSARVTPHASIAVPLLGRALDADGIVRDAELSGLLRSALEALDQCHAAHARCSIARSVDPPSAAQALLRVRHTPAVGASGLKPLTLICDSGAVSNPLCTSRKFS